MTLKELLGTVDLDGVLAAIEAAYPGSESDRPGYAKVLADLDGMAPIPPEGAMTIVVAREAADPPLAPEPYWRVIGRDGDTNWSLSFTPWAHWLGLPVTVEKCDLTPEQIVGHVLWEMTFHGFEESEIEEISDDLEAEVAKIKSLGDNPTAEDLEAAGLTPFRIEDDLEDDE